MNVRRRLLRLFNAGDTDLELFERALEPRVLPYDEPSWLKDRAMFLYIAFVRLGRAARAPASPRARTVVYDPGARDSGVRAARAGFMREHFGCDVDFFVADLLTGGGGPRRMTERERRAARRLRLQARCCAVAALFDPSGRYRWWGDVFATAHTFAQALDQIDDAFVFLLFDRRSYEVATFLVRHTGIETHVVFQSMPLYGNQRYLHVPAVAVVTSKVNIPEVAYFARQGWFKARETLYRSQEHVVERAGLTAAPPVYDIGFFATGDWARIDGSYWASDIAQVRAGAYRGNVYERYSELVLGWLADYARSRRRTLRVYMHPYERRLLHDHGIEPPYRSIADGDLVTIDDRPGSSRSSHFEADVAIALRSSTIWERIDLGLDRSFMYVYDDPGLGNLLPESVGEYQRNLFRSREELYARLDECFSATGEGAAGSERPEGR